MSRCLRDLEYCVTWPDIHIARILRVLSAVKALDGSFNHRVEYLLHKYNAIWNSEEQSAISIRQTERLPEFTGFDLPISDSDQPIKPKKIRPGKIWAFNVLRISLTLSAHSGKPASPATSGSGPSKKRKYSDTGESNLLYLFRFLRLICSSDTKPTWEHKTKDSSKTCRGFVVEIIFREGWWDAQNKRRICENNSISPTANIPADARVENIKETLGRLRNNGQEWKCITGVSIKFFANVPAHVSTVCQPWSSKFWSPF